MGGFVCEATGVDEWADGRELPPGPTGSRSGLTVGLITWNDATEPCCRRGPFAGAHVNVVTRESSRGSRRKGRY